MIRGWDEAPVLLDWIEAVGGECLLDGRGAEPVEEGMRVVAVGGFTQDDSTLADVAIGDSRHKDERTDLLPVRRRGRDERDETELGLAGLDQLGGLGKVFGDEKVRLELVV